MTDKLKRRNFLTRLSLAVSGVLITPLDNLSSTLKKMQPADKPDPVLSIKPLGFQWETSDPFLFCVHHEDNFPKGSETLGPDPSYFKDRQLGDDFIIKDGFRMYHGRTVPGFPGHPHRGFETVTVVRKGLVDHADSMGAAGRYGNGDVQWMTAGKGIQHSEMFPLLDMEKENPMELFQIWLNLPKVNKMVEPHFLMLWKDCIPNVEAVDAAGKKINVEVIAGKLGDSTAPPPPPDSWASDPLHELGIWNIKMEPEAQWTLPAASKGINRTLYFYEGVALTLAGKAIPKYSAVEVMPDQDLTLLAGTEAVSILVLQGKPISEPTIQYGPFVMNTKEEIYQAYEDYNRTQFGGWPWTRYDQVHARDKSRFARDASGKEEVKS